MDKWQIHDGGTDKLVLPPVGLRTTVTLEDLQNLALHYGVSARDVLLSIEGRDAGAYDGDVPVLIVLRGTNFVKAKR